MTTSKTKNSTTRKNSKTKKIHKQKMAKDEETLNEYGELGDALDLEEEVD